MFCNYTSGDSSPICFVMLAFGIGLNLGFGQLLYLESFLVGMFLQLSSDG
jgi:hypothetical protein